MLWSVFVAKCLECYDGAVRCLSMVLIGTSHLRQKQTKQRVLRSPSLIQTVKLLRP